MDSKQIIVQIPEIYKKYQTPENLILHMLRVSSVSNQIISNWTGEKIDKDLILAVCLIHDLGNIVKFNYNLSSGVSLLDKEFVSNPSFQKLKQSYIEKYGSDDEIANVKIAEEIGASSSIIDILSKMTLKTFRKYDSKPGFLELKICKYSDIRVSPFGIVSVRERLTEASSRYNFDLEKNIAEKERLETKIFSQTSISPSDITDSSCLSFIEKFSKKIFS